MTQNNQPFSLEKLFSLKGKIALISGGSSGIGKMIARGYVACGVTVYISSRKADVCEQVAKELSETGTCIAIPANITSPEDRKRLVSELTEKEDQLHILVNNAGTNWGADFEAYPDSAFDKVMGLNVNAMFSLTRDLYPLLAKAATTDDPARVINIGSMDGIHVPVVQQTGTYAYSASKAAVHHLTRTLAVDLGPNNITVNAIAPGYFESKMTDYALENFGNDIKKGCPLNRIGRPEDMAGIAIYLASRAGAYTNGTIIPIDGGSHLSKT